MGLAVAYSHPGHHPKPRWFELLERLLPDRCREVPEATEPRRILLRQFAIITRHVYLQSFASGENPHFFHRHPHEKKFVFVLRGEYTETRPVGGARRVKAPAFYSMDRSVAHHVTDPSPDHLSLSIGWNRVGEREYYEARVTAGGETIVSLEPIPWKEHVRQAVRRI